MSHPKQDLPGMTTYSDEISMGSGNGNNGVPTIAAVVPSVVEEPEATLIPQIVLQRPSEYLFGDQRIFLHAPQYHWHIQGAAGCRARPPKTPRHCRPPAVVAQVDLLSTLRDVSANLQNLRASSNRLFTDNRAPDNIDGAEDTGRDNLSVLTRTALHKQEQSWREKNYNPIQADTTFDTVQRHHLTHY